MGISLKIRAKDVEKSYELTFAGFMRFRKELAYELDYDFGKAYEKFCGRNITIDEMQEAIDTIQNDGDWSDSVIDFFFASDVQGKYDMTTLSEMEILFTNIMKLGISANCSYTTTSVSIGKICQTILLAIKKGKAEIEWY